MARQVAFTKHEAALLLDAYLKVVSGELSRMDSVKECSRMLRAMAVNSGVEIEDIYRNVNGISFQMASMESAYQGRTIMKPATRLFTEMVTLFMTNKEEYRKLLKEAKDMADTTQNNEATFMSWLSENVSATQLSELSMALVEIEQQAKKVKLVKHSLYEMLEPSAVKKIRANIEQSRVMSRAKMFYDQTKRREGLIAGSDFVTLDEVQTISFTDTNEMRAALKGYLEQGTFTVGDYKGTGDAGVILCGNIRKEIMDADGYSNMFTELPTVFHESALIERFHGFIKGWNIPRMKDDLKVNGWALNSEYFCSIMHELRSDMTYRSVVDEYVIVPEGADTRDTEAVKRIATAYLKLLFPHVQHVDDISPREFKRYCFDRARRMRDTIKYQLGLLDEEYAGKDLPAFKINGIDNV